MNKSCCRSGLSSMLVSVVFGLFIQAVPALGVSEMGRQAGTQDVPVVISGSSSRTWASSDGKYSVEGTLIAVEGKNIRIETAQGKVVQVAVEKLSAVDQAFVIEESKRVASQAENPFMELKEDEGRSPFESTARTNTANLDADPEMLRLRTVELISEEGADASAAYWQVQPRTPVQKFRVNAYSFHSQVTASLSATDERFFAISFFEPFGISPGAFGKNATASPVKAWVEILKLPEAESLGRFPLLDERSIAGDIDPSGKHLLTYDGTFAHKPKIRLFEIGADGLVLVSSWLSKNGDGRNEPVSSARILADGKVVTCFSGPLIVWNANPVEPVFLFGNDSPDGWELAADRRHAWVEKGGKRYEVDLIDGKCTGVVGDRSSKAIATEAVSADGQRFATLKDSVMTVRKADGEIIDEFFAPVFWPNPELAWVDENTIRVQSPNQHHFVDLPRRAVFLEVTDHGGPKNDRGWTAEKTNSDSEFFVTVGQSNSIGQQSPILEQYRRKLPTDSESMSLFREGDRISLSLQLDAAPNQKGEAKTLLTNLLKSRGVVIDDDAEDQLRASSEARNQTIEYRRFGSPPWDPNGTESVNVKTVENRLELVRAGKVVWSKSSKSGPGFMLHMNENETVQEAVDRQAGDPMQFWKSLQLPKHVSPHPGGGAWSRVQKNGEGYQEINQP